MSAHPTIRFTVSAAAKATDNELVMTYEEERENPRRALVAQVVQDIATDVWVKLKGLSMGDVTLAMIDDPDHWADDWRGAFEAAGLDPDTDVDEFIAGLAS